MSRVFLLLHRFLLRCDIILLPVHYYSQAASIRVLAKTKQRWVHASELPGLDVNLERQVEFLSRFITPYQSEIVGNAVYKEAISELGQEYEYIDAQVLFAFLRHFKPKRIVEVGSGVSTRVIAKGVESNRVDTGEEAELICIEPYHVLDMPDGVQVLKKEVQDVDMEVFAGLDDGDFLFIDSSHTVKPDGDVNFLYLEVLPRLKAGVFVHMHDIYFPYDYAPSTLWNFFQWNETSLLRALLMHSTKFEILFSMCLLHHQRPEALKRLLPEYDPTETESGLWPPGMKPYSWCSGHFPMSIYIKVTGDT